MKVLETKEILKKLRSSKDLTIQEVAEKSGVSYSAYQKYELGIREIGAKSLEKLADFYGVSTDYLLGRPGAAPPENPIDQIPTVDEMERDLFREWLTLDKSARTAFLNVLRNIVAADNQRKTDAEARVQNGTESKYTYTIQVAARGGEPPHTEEITQEERERIANLPRVPDDL